MADIVSLVSSEPSSLGLPMVSLQLVGLCAPTGWLLLLLLLLLLPLPSPPPGTPRSRHFLLRHRRSLLAGYQVGGGLKTIKLFTLLTLKLPSSSLS